MQATIKPTLIEKEVISTLTFNNRTKVNQHPNLLSQIKDATTLGNNLKSKVSIYFEDDHGIKRVDTTIWAHGTKYVCLKGGVWLPIDRIVEIKS